MFGLASLPPLKTLIDAHSLATRKALGQHFLLDSRITGRIATYAGDLQNVNVIEVGPGPGGLTRSLLAAGATVYAIEKDERCLTILAQLQEVSGGKLTVVHGDALDIDPTTLAPAPRKIVANLPYNVGTQMLINWLGQVYENPGAYESLTLMFQKEVAERIIAEPRCKDYGRLSVLAQWLCETRYDMELPSGAFSPPPKVSSAVITLIPRKAPLVPVAKSSLETVVAKAFGQRRKMLRSALKGLPVPAEILLAEAGIDGTLRAEQLDVKTLCRLAQAFEKMK